MCTVRPKLGVFSKLSKYNFFCCFITRVVKKLQQWSLYKGIEDILPFVWIQNVLWAIFGCWDESNTVLWVLEKNHNLIFFKKHPSCIIWDLLFETCSLRLANPCYNTLTLVPFATKVLHLAILLCQFFAFLRMTLFCPFLFFDVFDVFARWKLCLRGNKLFL